MSKFQPEARKLLLCTSAHKYDLKPQETSSTCLNFNTPLLSAARTQTEFARRAFSVAAPHTWNSLPSDIRTCHNVHTLKNTSKHTCSDSLSLKPPAPLYRLQDFKALHKYCIIIIIINIKLTLLRTLIMRTHFCSSKLSKVLNHYTNVRMTNIMENSK